MVDVHLKPESGRYIYIACPWAPMGGGMYKVADYMIQAQASVQPDVSLKPLDTRGGGSSLMSPLFLAMAMVKVLRGRLTGELQGVHINMAERLSLFRKGALLWFARALGVPVVLHLHAAQLKQFYSGLPAWLRALTRATFQAANAVVVLGEQARQFVLTDLHVPADRVEILLNGVPENPVPKQARDPQQPFKLLFLGNLMERKGVSDLLKALASPLLQERAGQWHASFAGGGDVDHYRQLAASLGLTGQVTFVGWADQAKAASLIAAADTLALPSYDEGLPLVILEALAKGVAVIATPVGEIPSALTNEQNCLMVPAGDVDAIARAVRRLMDDLPLHRQLSDNGRALYLERFSMAVFFANVARIHQRVFGHQAAPKSGQP
jgi:glycosyltransferase involved in cell wall biosynthesis